MKDLIASLKTRLESIGGIQQVFMYKNAEPTLYPAIICNWESSQNDFETINQNKRNVSFRLFVVINVAGKSMEQIDEVVIPNTYDLVSSYFDTNWNFGTSDEGHRVWSVLSLANSEISIEGKSKLAYLDCVLTIQYLKDN